MIRTANPGDFFEKMRHVERVLAKKRGNFTLFALVMRQDSAGKWDVVVSAPWICDGREDLEEIVLQALNSILTPDEVLRNVSIVVPLDPSHELVETLTRQVAVEPGGMVDVGNVVVGGHEFGRTRVLVSRPLKSELAESSTK
jgi:hypothetical protein